MKITAASCDAVAGMGTLGAVAEEANACHRVDQDGPIIGQECASQQIKLRERALAPISCAQQI